jgi:hypothetical protein
MPFVPFYQFDPELAQRETRTLYVAGPGDGLPDGDYGLFEMYCDEPGCDCRRVLFTILSSRFPKPLAVINYGWESLSFYAQGTERIGWNLAEEMKGPNLNPGSPQSRFAPQILDLVKQFVLRDRAYIERLQRHYRIVREAVDGKRAPENKTARPKMVRLDPRAREQIRARKMKELRARRSLKRNANLH